MAPSAETRVRRARDAGATVREVRTKDHTSLVLGAPRTGGRGRPSGSLALMVDGKLTAVGQAYERLTGEQLARPAAFIGDPYFVNNSQWINAGGVRRKLSSWIRGREVLTAWGKRYYAENPTSYIVHVPATRTVRRRDGSLHDLPETKIPIEWERAPHESDNDFRTKMIRHVTDMLPAHYTDQSTHEIRVDYSARGTDRWGISRKTVHADGSVEVTLDSSLRAPDGRHTFAVRPECIVDRAFQASANCCVTQLAPRLGLPEDQLEDLFADAARELYGGDEYPFGCAGDWRLDLGVTPRMIASVCARLGHSCHAFADDAKVLQHIVTSRHDKPAISFSFGNGHLWLLDESVNRSLSSATVAGKRQTRLLHRLEGEFKSTVGEGVNPWPDDPLVGPPPAGAFTTMSAAVLLDVRRRLLEQGRCPRVFWHTMDEPKSLKYVRTKEEGEGTFILRCIPPEYEFLRNASEILDREYNQQGLSSWLLRMLRAELKGERHYLRVERKRAILRKQDSKCAHCSDELQEDTAEFDHIIPRACGGKDFQALCAACHLEKTVQQSDLTHAGVSLASVLSDHVWEALVEKATAVSGVTLQLEQPPLHGLQYLDKVRSRTSILKTSKFPWPVCIPQDQIRPWDPASGLGQNGFYYVEVVKPETPAEALRILPLRGPGWHHVSAVTCAISLGVITTDAVKLELKPSASLPASQFSAALCKVTHPLPDDDVVLGDGSERNLQKDACNALVGLWGRRSYFELRASCSEKVGDQQALAPHGESWRRHTGVGQWYDIFAKTPRVGRTTYFLLHRSVLDQEACMLACMVRCVEGRIYEINTDSILYAGNRVEAKDWKCVITQGRRLVGTRRLIVRDDPLPEAVPDWTDVSEEQVEAHVLAGGSLCIEALAGCGKSTLLRRLSAILREAGKKVMCCATTHVATANLQDPSAQTLARLYHSHGQGVRRPFNVLIIDEMSCVHTLVWSFLASVLAHNPCQVICAGDWFQLPPVQDSANLHKCPSMRDRDFLRQICGHTRLRLTDCHRSDPGLFRFYSQLTSARAADLRSWVARAREAFPPIPGPSPINLCMSHVQRVELNAALLKVYMPRDVQTYWADPGPCNAVNNKPQRLCLWRGQQLICASTRHDFRNRWSYTIVEIDAQTAVLEADGLGTRTKALPHATVASIFRLPYARTYHAAQGMEWDRVRLWGCSEPTFTLEHLMVGLSRCRSSTTLDFGR